MRECLLPAAPSPAASDPLLMWAGPECRVNCIKGEIHNVIASLRLGWAAQSQFLADFKGLHEQLCEVSSAHS